MRHVIDILTSQLVLEIDNRFIRNAPVSMREEFSTDEGRGQYIGNLKLGWECHEEYDLRRTAEYVLICLKGTISLQPRYLIVYFRPDDRPSQKPRLMRRFVRAGPSVALILGPQSRESLIQEQLLLCFVRWKVKDYELLANQLTQELMIPESYISRLAGKESATILRRCVAQMLLNHWADPTDASSYERYKIFCINQVLRDYPELLCQGAVVHDRAVVMKDVLIGEAGTKSPLHDCSEVTFSRLNRRGEGIGRLRSREGYAPLQLAREVGVSVNTIYRWIRDGKLLREPGLYPVRIPAGEYEKAMQMGKRAYGRAGGRIDRKRIIDYVAQRDGITARSARRKLERLRRSGCTYRIRQLMKELLAISDAEHDT